MSAFIAARIAGFSAEAPEKLRWQSPFVAEFSALPLYLGWTETIGIRADGAVVSWSTEGDYAGAQPVQDRIRMVTALVAGAERHPELRALLPERPAEASDCPCRKQPLLASGKVLCGECGGIGWLPAPLPDTSIVSTRGEGAEPPALDEAWDFLAPAQQPDEVGRLGPYRVLRVLGQGGMGVVFQAEDPKLQRVVALKAMLPALAISLSARKRFLREAKAAAAVQHDHIVRIFEVGEDRDVPFLTMEFLHGESLDARMKRGPLSFAEVLRVGRQIAKGLAAAHDRALIHRDIKPGNIWLEPTDDEERLEETGQTDRTAPVLSHPSSFRVKILDFGLARSTGDDPAHLTRSGAILGTPAYMAPEQATGQPLDPRCDLFSLGCVLYRLSVGELPFKGKNTLAVLAALANTTPTPPRTLIPRIPARLSDLIVRLLAKDRDQRPASAHEVVNALDACRAQDDTAGPSNGPLEATGQASRPGSGKKRAVVAGLILAGLALVGALAALVIAPLLFLPPSSIDKKGGFAQPNPPSVNPKPIEITPAKKKTVDPSAPPDYALVLDGNCIVTVNSLKLNRSAPLTLEAYVSVLKADKLEPTHLAGTPQQFSLFTGGTQAKDGTHWCLGAQYQGSFQHLFDPAPMALLGRRVHLAGVREGRSVRMYLDGRLISKREVEELLLNDALWSFNIGNNAPVFQGTIDEVRVSMIARYDRDFTPAKRFEPDLDTLALYHMDEGKGRELKDSSGNNHHGVIQGNARWVRVDAPAP